MHDLFGPTSQQINEANKAHAVNFMALAMLLVDKGIATEDEILNAQARATHYVDQNFAAKEEEVKKKFDEEHPGVRELLESLLGVRKESD